MAKCFDTIVEHLTVVMEYAAESMDKELALEKEGASTIKSVLKNLQ